MWVIALDGAGEVELMGQTMVIDPYSEFAVERAVQLKEELGGTVTLLTLGSQDCLAAVRHGLAMGADAAVLIEDEQWTARDAAQAAALLAEAASTMGADLVMGGWKSGDTAAAQVMGRMAAIMRLPLANMATGLSVEGGTIVAECEVDDGVETAMSGGATRDRSDLHAALVSVLPFLFIAAPQHGRFTLFKKTPPAGF